MGDAGSKEQKGRHWEEEAAAVTGGGGRQQQGRGRGTATAAFPVPPPSPSLREPQRQHESSSGAGAVGEEQGGTHLQAARVGHGVGQVRRGSLAPPPRQSDQYGAGQRNHHF